MENEGIWPGAGQSGAVGAVSETMRAAVEAAISMQ